MSVPVRLVPAHRLRDAAIISHMGLRQRGRITDTGLERNADRATVERWMVNYARHMLTDYDRLIRAADDPAKVKRDTLAAIADTYPFLAAECARQASALKDA